MSCSINRYKFTGGCAAKTPDTTASKEMEARMKEMLAVREAQDGGNFKVRPSWDPVAKTTPEVNSSSAGGTQLNWGK
jgi:hypothetical protein